MDSLNIKGLPYNKSILNRAQQDALLKSYKRSSEQDQDRIRSLLLGANWRLVYKIAKRYLDVLDIGSAMSAGFKGLIRAIDKINTDAGISLSTVAYRWIKMELKRASKGVEYTVPVPEYVLTIINKRIRKYNSDNDDNPEWIDSCPFKELSMFLAYRQKIISIDYESDDESGEHHECYEPRSDYDIPSNIDFHIDVLNAVNKINDVRARNILIKYYNLDGKGAYTLDELGSEHGITRERVRQIKNYYKLKLADLLADYRRK